MRTTIFDDIGGEPAVAALVDALYQRLLADPDLVSHFEGSDVQRLQAHQRALLTVALGGSAAEYAGRMMQPAHAGLAISHEAFDRVLDHLRAALAGAGVAPPTAARILAILQPLRADVVQAGVPATR